MQMKAHGGDIYGVSEALGIPVEKCLDFSANINPLGIPAGMKAAMEAALAQTIHYPDPECKKLTQALGNRLHVKPETILCGNGGADLIYRIVYAAKPKKAVLPAPVFLAYEEALLQVGAEISYYRMDESMEIGREILELITEETDILFLCTPNNPTGLLISGEVLEAAVKRAEETGTRIVLDECFMDFVVKERRSSMMKAIGRYPNLVIVKSFTKLYGIPGVRLGYAVCSDALFLQKMRAAGQTWPVNSIAMAAGLAALSEEAFAAETVEYVRREREWLFGELENMGFTVWDGQADYLFFRAPGHEDLYEKLLRSGIIIRRCCNYVNLTAEHYRIAVKRHEENERLVRHLRMVLGQEEEPIWRQK